jgi:hypothetical protein
MVYDDDGEFIGALESPEEGQQGSNVTGCVLVDPMEADEGIEDEHLRPEGSDGAVEALTVGFEVQAERRSGDHLKVEVFDAATDDCADANDTLSDDMQGVLGSEEQDPPRGGNPGWRI